MSIDFKKLRAPLKISDIDFRVQSINSGGYAILLAYKDARVDMRVLDDVVGAESWQRDFKIINNVLYCGIGIFNDKTNQWIWKYDAGTESFSDKEKGQASDSFKRAGFNWGIGRELYDYPLIQVKLNQDEFKVDGGGRAKQTWNLKLKEWRWMSQFKDGVLTFLAAKDQNDKVRFKWGEYDKNITTEELKSSSATDSNELITEDAIIEVPAQEITRGTTNSEEAGNVSGILKKSAEPIEEAEEPSKEVLDSAREEAYAVYKELFGRSPRKDMTTESIISKIAEKQAEMEADEASDEEENPAGVYSDSGSTSEESEVADEYKEDGEAEAEDEEVEEAVEDIQITYNSYVSEIETHKIPTSFVDWAKSVIAELTGKVSSEMIDDFKSKCNSHYESITK